MRILQLCLRLPYPPNDGGTIAMYNMSRSLELAGAEVKIISFNTKKHFVPESSIPVDFMQRYQPEMVYLDATVKPWDALINLFGSGSYNIVRFDIPEMHRKISEVLSRQSFDVIHLESLFMAPYLDTIRAASKVPVYLRTHNVEFRIWERLADSCRNPLSKWYLQLLTKRLRRYESAMINRFDGLIVLTNEDRDLLIKSGAHQPILVSPISIDTLKYQDRRSHTDAKAVFHLGSMDWMPNIEGVDWFLMEVFPLLKKRNASLNIHLAGKAMPDRIFRMASEILHISGKVDHAVEFMSGKQIMVVPLLSGGGMRVKIIEGMAMGKTIISTPVGAEGIRYTHGKNILIASNPTEFADAILRCINDESMCRLIGENARLLAQEIYDIRNTGNEIITFYNSCSSNRKEFSSLFK